MAGRVKITLKKSSIDRPARQKATLKALGLKRINQTVEHENTPQIEGMVKAVNHLVAVEQL